MINMNICILYYSNFFTEKLAVRLTTANTNYPRLQKCTDEGVYALETKLIQLKILNIICGTPFKLYRLKLTQTSECQRCQNEKDRLN